MEVSYFMSLIIIFSLNVLFFFSGICLNSLVILSFWKSAHLRKKLCYFMLMVLSCCDLLAVLTNHPLLALTAMLWSTEKFDTLPRWMDRSLWLSNAFLGFSLVALLVMNFDRYLATCYPLLHLTSVTKKKLLTFFGILSVVEITLYLMSVKEFFSTAVLVLICFVIIFPPMLFINYKLYTVARKSRRNNNKSPQIKKTLHWKNISSCLLAVACFVVLSIPVIVYIGLRITSNNFKDHLTLNNIQLVRLWAKTIVSMNSTFNCLIFYWKNKVLRKNRILNAIRKA